LIFFKKVANIKKNVIFAFIKTRKQKIIKRVNIVQKRNKNIKKI